MRTLLLIAFAGTISVSSAWNDTVIWFDTNGVREAGNTAAEPETPFPDSQDSHSVNSDSDRSAPSRPALIIDTLGGNLPRVIERRDGHYLVTSDIYVPSGKTVTIKPGVVLLFKNFTELHVEGQLIAEGTAEHPIVFTSELDQAWNRGSSLVANPYDWNGILTHESGIGSILTNCIVSYTVYGLNSLTRYIKIGQVTFRNNGRADLTINGQRQEVTEKPHFYALSIADAKKDGIPVAILMDPKAKKRNLLRYGGIGTGTGGVALLVWSLTLLSNDQKKLNDLSNRMVTDENSPIVAASLAEWNRTKLLRDRDRWLAATSVVLMSIGGTGFSWSFMF